MMGVPLMHQAWQTGVEKFVAIGAVCAYPKYTPIPFYEEAIPYTAQTPGQLSEAEENQFVASGYEVRTKGAKNAVNI
jgi:hypothetical protein